MLYNEYELQWMIKAIEQFNKQNKAVIDEMADLPEEFKGCDNKDKMEALNNIEFASHLAFKLKEELAEVEKANFMPLDPDHQGELLVLCAELHTAWDTNPHIYFEGRKPEEIGYEYYMLGNIEGRLKSGRVTMEDLGMLDAWEEEMNE